MSITIGIPAYNEEANIRRLLLTLLAQKTTICRIKEIIVISDKSDDSTNQEVRSIKNKKIKLIINSKRLGTALSQNKITKLFKSDALVIINADTLIKDLFFIQRLTLPLKDKKIGVVCPQVLPIKGGNFFERIINYSVQYKKAIFVDWKVGNNLYLCVGVARAFSKECVERMTWKKVVSEDAYSYLDCVRLGYKFFFNSRTTIFYKSPSNFKDHLQQSLRFLSGKKEMLEYFDEKLIKKEYLIPTKIKLSNAIKYFFKNPILFSAYLLILAGTFISSRTYEIDYAWKQSKSSKSLANV